MSKSVRNPNTAKLWDRLLIQQNDELVRSPFYQDKITKVFKFIKRRPGKFLDIGFGMGNLERKISRHPKIEIYGIDFSPKAVSLAKKSLNGKYLVGNIFKIPFKAEFFDSVAVLDVLEHIEKEKTLSALREIKRVIKKGGLIVISVPINENLKQLNKEGRNINRHLREYTLPILTKELKKVDFLITGHEYLYAFRKLYKPKSFVIKLAPHFRKPNLLMVYAKKK